MKKNHFANFPLGREKNASESAKQKISNQQREEHKKMKNANRNLSRLLACALVFLLALTAAIPVLAAEQDNLKVVINNKSGLPKMSEGQFNVYQLFTGTPHKEETKGNTDHGADNWNNYTLADVKWGESIKDDGANLLTALKGVTDKWAMDEVTDTNIFKDVNEKDAAGLAKVLEKHTDAVFMQHFAKTVAGVSGLVTVDGKPVLSNGKNEDASDDYLTYTFTKPGYYMFADAHTPSTTVPDARSEYILAVLGYQEINLKASVPDVEKDIVVDTVSGKEDAKGDVAGVSDYVQFKLTGTLPMNFDEFESYKYIFHDTLSKSLTFVNDAAHQPTVRVYANKDDADADTNFDKNTSTVIPVNGNYTVSEETDDPCNLEISFNNLKALNSGSQPIDVTAKSVFVVTYYAQVNNDAVILSVGNPNTVQLEYANDPNDPNGDSTGKTVERKVNVFAFGLDLTKVDGNEKGLEGAGFVLKDKDDNYAIFKDQYVLTSADQKEQTFYDTQGDAESAKTKAGNKGEVSGPVRRLTGWTTTDGSNTTEAVKNLIKDYKDKKAIFDAATNAEREKTGSAYLALQTAKGELQNYFLEAGEGSNGQLPDVYGLDAATYKLEEVIVPDGYNRPEEDFDIKIDANIKATGELEKVVYTHGGETVTYLSTAAEYDTAPLGTEAKPVGDELTDRVARFKTGLLKDNIENQKAPLLPFTGGIGTIIFYVLGDTLIVGAVVYLVIVYRKHKKTEENT